MWVITQGLVCDLVGLGIGAVEQVCAVHLAPVGSADRGYVQKIIALSSAQIVHRLKGFPGDGVTYSWLTYTFPIPFLQHKTLVFTGENGQIMG